MCNPTLKTVEVYEREIPAFHPCQLLTQAGNDAVANAKIEYIIEFSLADGNGTYGRFATSVDEGLSFTNVAKALRNLAKEMEEYDKHFDEDEVEDAIERV